MRLIHRSMDTQLFDFLLFGGIYDRARPPCPDVLNARTLFTRAHAHALNTSEYGFREIAKAEVCKRLPQPSCSDVLSARTKTIENKTKEARGFELGAAAGSEARIPAKIRTI